MMKNKYHNKIQKIKNTTEKLKKGDNKIDQGFRLTKISLSHCLNNTKNGFRWL